MLMAGKLDGLDELIQPATSSVLYLKPVSTV
jgi:hypothetical protein